MYIGIDLGTSGVKALLMSNNGQVLASSTSPLTVSRPQELWSEQDPSAWWRAMDEAIQTLASNNNLQQVQAIGLSGQMHGATLLDKHDQVLRPAILWNDGRSFAECRTLQRKCPEIQGITGNLVMPGFTAPKLLWLKEHEPELFARIAKVLLPKDYLRFRMTGKYATDVSDASGTLWLDMEQRTWSCSILEATGLTIEQMPLVYEGTEITGRLSSSLATRWNMPCVPVVAGGGDNAAGAVGVGVIHPEEVMLSLGTSGVMFAVSDGFTANPAMALHSFGHAISQTWHTMSVMLSAASCLEWVTQLTQFSSVPEAIQAAQDRKLPQKGVIFLPYLSGERTPHNDPKAKGVFWGMTHETQPADLVQAVMEGVCFALLDGLDAIQSAQRIQDCIDVIGGGARSHYWLQMLADSFGTTMNYRKGGDMGPALGAARLAALGVRGEQAIAEVCRKPELIQSYKPNIDMAAYYADKRLLFQALYQRVIGL